MVLDLSGILRRFFFACSTALAMAEGTSAAFPFPTPTHPFSVANHHQCREGKSLPTLDNLGNPVNGYRLIL
jgi:hypothetical protein